jgi:hypothetical protein
MPMAGVQHVFANREILALTFVNVLSNQGADGQIFGIYEYKPRLNDTWSIYSRVQLMYIQGIFETSHRRSFLYLRAGLKKALLALASVQTGMHTVQKGRLPKTLGCLLGGSFEECQSRPLLRGA